MEETNKFSIMCGPSICKPHALQDNLTLLCKCGENMFAT